MKKTLFTLGCGIFVTACAVPQSTPKTFKKPTRDLIILLDFGQSEELSRTGGRPGYIRGSASPRLAALTSTVLPALYQQAAPLLVSKALLKTIMARKLIFHDCVTSSLGTLHKKYDRNKITRALSLAQFKRHCMYAHRKYNEIKHELAGIFKQGTAQEIDKAIDTLTTKQIYLETAAPRSLQLYSNNSRSLKRALHRELQAYTLCAYAPLTPQKFIMKDVSSDLALLIPRSYYTQEDTNKAQYTAGQKTVTALEKKLGIKVHHLPDITDSSFFMKTMPINYTVPLAHLLSQILVTKKEGSTHIWVLYLSGHGLPTYQERNQVQQLESLKKVYQKQPIGMNHRAYTQRRARINQKLNKTQRILKHLPATHENIICSLPMAEFQRVLEFSNTQISTSLVFYTTCFGAGEHLITPYKKGTQNLRFTYDIIVASVSDAVSLQDAPMLLIPPYKCTPTTIEGITRDSFDVRQKCLTLRSLIHFNQFFKKTRDSQRDYHSFTTCLHPYFTSQGTFIHSNLENIAHVRPAQNTTFQVISRRPSLCKVPQQPCTIPQSTEVAFLTRSVNPSLKLPHKLPTFISLTPGPSWHCINQITAPQTTLKELINSFLALPTLSSPKLFWIKKVECKQTSTVPPLLPLPFGSTKPRILHNVIIARNICTTDALRHSTTNSVYFTGSNGTCWHIPIKGTLGTAERTSWNFIEKELFSLFPALRAATLKR